MSSDVRVRLGLENGEFLRGISEARETLNAFGLSIGSLSTVGLIEFMRGAMESAEQIENLAARTGLTTTEVQQFSFAAQQTGSSAETMARAIVTLERQTAAAQNAMAGAGDEMQFMSENGELVAVSGNRASQALATLGIDAQRFFAMSPSDRILEIAEAFHRVGDAGLPAVFDLLGRSAGDLLPMLRMNREELQSLLNVDVADSETIRGLARMETQLSTLLQSARAAGIEIAGWLGRNVLGTVALGVSAVESQYEQWTRGGEAAAAFDLEADRELNRMGLLPDYYVAGLSDRRREQIAPPSEPERTRRPIAVPVDGSGSGSTRRGGGGGGGGGDGQRAADRLSRLRETDFLADLSDEEQARYYQGMADLSRISSAGFYGMLANQPGQALEADSLEYATRARRLQRQADRQSANQYQQQADRQYQRDQQQAAADEQALLDGMSQQDQLEYYRNNAASLARVAGLTREDGQFERADLLDQQARENEQRARRLQNQMAEQDNRAAARREDRLARVREQLDEEHLRDMTPRQRARELQRRLDAANEQGQNAMDMGDDLAALEAQLLAAQLENQLGQIPSRYRRRANTYDPHAGFSDLYRRNAQAVAGGNAQGLPVFDDAGLPQFQDRLGMDDLMRNNGNLRPAQAVAGADQAAQEEADWLAFLEDWDMEPEQIADPIVESVDGVRDAVQSLADLLSYLSTTYGDQYVTDYGETTTYNTFSAGTALDLTSVESTLNAISTSNTGILNRLENGIYVLNPYAILS